jgi:hypothetical protein
MGALLNLGDAQQASGDDYAHALIMVDHHLRDGGCGDFNQLMNGLAVLKKPAPHSAILRRYLETVEYILVLLGETFDEVSGQEQRKDDPHARFYRDWGFHFSGYGFVACQLRVARNHIRQGLGHPTDIDPTS